MFKAKKKKPALILKTALLAVFALGFILFFAPLFTATVNLGNIFGMLFFALASAITLFWQKLSPLLRLKWVRITVCIRCALAGILFILAVIISVFMIKTFNNPDPGGNTVLVVLGCRVRGETPSRMLLYRALAAGGYMKAHPEVKCVVSGGQGSGEMISEAECMRRILISEGISEDRIFLEDKSTNTYENMAFSKKVIEENGLSGSVTVVSSEYHLLRARIVAEKQGFDEVYTISNQIKTPLGAMPSYWVREIFGVAYEIVF
jgi:uncharacterized SAM-binding protein YcdF (DUF218 family)